MIAIIQPQEVFLIIVGFLWELRWWIFLAGVVVAAVLIGLEKGKEKS